MLTPRPTGSHLSRRTVLKLATGAAGALAVGMAAAEGVRSSHATGVDPDPVAPWRPLYTAVFGNNASARTFSGSHNRADFLRTIDAQRAANRRAVAVVAYPTSADNTLYDAQWLDTTAIEAAHSVIDLDVTSAELSASIAARAAAGMELLEIAVADRASGGYMCRYDIATQPTVHGVAVERTEADLQAWLATEKVEGRHPVALASRAINGAVVHTAVTRRGGLWAELLFGVTDAQLATRRARRYIEHVSVAARAGGEPRYVVGYLWNDAASDQIVLTGLNREKLTAKIAELSARGFVLTSLAVERVQAFQLSTFVQALRSGMDGIAVGWAASACFANVQSNTQGGAFRTALDGFRAANATSRHNVVDATRPITAVALVKALRAKGLAATDLIHPYLPAGWVRGSNITKLTFENLLSHRSGFTGEGETYDALRGLVAQGVPAARPALDRHANLALARVLIAQLVGFTPSPGGDLAKDTANAYLAYVNSAVLGPAGIAAAAASPGVDPPVRAYPNPPDNVAGTTFHDWTLRTGSRGLFLSVAELARFANVLWGSDTLLTAPERSRMWAARLGWSSTPAQPQIQGTMIHETGSLQVNTVGGLAFTETALCAFSRGLRVAITVNSPTADGMSLSFKAAEAFHMAWVTP